MAITRPTTKTIISTTGWGIPITDEVNRMTPYVASTNPKGFIQKKTVGTTSGGYTAAFEWGTALNFTIPATVGRRYSFVYRVGMRPDSGVTAHTYLQFYLRHNDRNGTLLGSQIFGWTYGSQGFNTDTQNVISSFDDFTQSPGQLIQLDVLIGQGSWSMFGNSYAILYDIGGV